MVLSAAELFPPFGLVLRTPDLVLRPGDEACAVRLANAVFEHGIHDPARSPFATAWTDADPRTVARSVFANVLSAVRAKEPNGPWSLKFVVRRADRPDDPIGVMDLRQHAEVRDEVGTGSWLLRTEHRKGYGTQARAAVLKLAFLGLGMREARTAAYTYNSASLGVTRKLGYRQIGFEDRIVRGESVESAQFAVTREQWESSPAAMLLNPNITWIGLDAVRELFGTDTPYTVAKSLARA